MASPSTSRNGFASTNSDMASPQDQQMPSSTHLYASNIPTHQYATSKQVQASLPPSYESDPTNPQVLDGVGLSRDTINAVFQL
jgi:hypothetical protein